MVKIETTKDVGELGRSVMLRAIIDEQIENIDFPGRVLILNVKEGKGIVTEHHSALIIEAVEEQIPNPSAKLSGLYYTDEEFPTIIVSFHKYEGKNVEIIFFKDDSELIPFLHDADLSNKWIVS